MALSPNETQTTPATPQAPISADLPEAGVVPVSPSHTQPMAGVVPVSHKTISTTIRAPPVARTHAHNQRQYTWQRSTQTHTTTAFNTRLSLADSRSCGRGESPPHTRNPRAHRARGEKPASSPSETQLSPHDTASSKRPAYPSLDNAVKTGERAPMARPQTHTRAPTGARPPMQAIRAVSPAGRQRPRPAPGAGSTGRARPGSRAGTLGGR